ncbi:hypothetical protein CBR_g41496 [Chara braunii]|uniref:Reverse transcriptase domain-containing protein n=1 Tax=Chara braunii TaxID=69332 RepID=A0A388LW76_CHABU|nr:hypothetical protein CBR_g41496 [Chara braunii]|eukprot:GBG86503.1 hypothetical protein CBR_g41496 [Chara braunii]
MVALLLDLEKPYDRVNWDFVLDTLRLAGFGDTFCRWVQALYTTSTGRVMVNGEISESFPLTRSLRQGCPLAPMLFVIQMEVLLSMIRNHPAIVGLQLGHGNQCKASAMADDLFAMTIKNETSLNALKFCLDTYSKFSEALVNWSKSVAILKQDANLAVDWGLKCLLAEGCDRFLGVQVGIGGGEEDGSAGRGIRGGEKVQAVERSWESREEAQGSQGARLRVGKAAVTGSGEEDQAGEEGTTLAMEGRSPQSPRPGPAAHRSIEHPQWGGGGEVLQPARWGGGGEVLQPAQWGGGGEVLQPAWWGVASTVSVGRCFDRPAGEVVGRCFGRLGGEVVGRCFGGLGGEVVGRRFGWSGRCFGRLVGEVLGRCFSRLRGEVVGRCFDRLGGEVVGWCFGRVDGEVLQPARWGGGG